MTLAKEALPGEAPEWSVEVNHGTDSDGWQYGSVFKCAALALFLASKGSKWLICKAVQPFLLSRLDCIILSQ